ncbi:hypothetical protein BDZ88DRAFT_61127 [Geranomyces variabilis]|nr:hypothetical protein BDZ88DRAFT_61127 [Geranomyces variabilis]
MSSLLLALLRPSGSRSAVVASCRAFTSASAESPQPTLPSRRPPTFVTAPAFDAPNRPRCSAETLARGIPPPLYDGEDRYPWMNHREAVISVRVEDDARDAEDVPKSKKCTMPTVTEGGGCY